MHTDPRYTQIAILFGLVVLGYSFFEIGLSLRQLLFSVVTALACQYCFSRFFHKVFDWRSPLITGLSLSLLLRMNEPLWVVVAAFIAIASKFLLQLQSRHVFNPANFAIVVLLLCDAGVWVSPGQWGSAWILGLFLIVLGLSVLAQTRQWDIAFVFLVIYASLLFGRALYLGDTLTIPLHQLQSGALLIFAFFMLSDPKTIPAKLRMRIVFAALVAVLSFYLQFAFYVREAIFYSLFMVCCLYATSLWFWRKWV